MLCSQHMQTIARLQGDTVRDLIEALSRLDPDAAAPVSEVRTVCPGGNRRLDFGDELPSKSEWVDLNNECDALNDDLVKMAREKEDLQARIVELEAALDRALHPAQGA